ncbi:MAG: IS3 family transposase [Pseudomonadota bacterium]
MGDGERRFKKVAGNGRRQKKEAFQIVRRLRAQYPVVLLCRVLGVTPGGYYAFCNRRPSERQREDAAIVAHMRQIHRRVSRTYGSPRMTVALNEAGFSCAENRVARLMRVNGIRAKMESRYKPRQWTSKSKIRKPNLLASRGFPGRPHETWVADFTYLSVGNSTLYLSVVMDLYTRKVVGYDFTNRRDGPMVKRTLQKARRANQGVKTKIFHSDRGSEYANHLIGEFLAQMGIEQSMSDKGNCYDNAHMESFFHSYKSEVLYGEKFSTKTELIARTRSWMMFYNHHRYHSSLDYTSPLNFEKMAA